MKILFLGDIHGEWDAANETIRKARFKYPDISHIIQVGDCGDGWAGPDFRWPVEHADDLPIHWCDGNHENFDLIDAAIFNNRLTYQPRGSIIEIDGFRIMFMGGATSIDKDYRTPYIDWWPQEDITYGQIAVALQQQGPIDLIVSHERPESIPIPPGMRYIDIGKANCACLEALLQHFKPNWWAYGHYHRPNHGRITGTEYVCCPKIDVRNNNYVVFDGNKFICSWE
jgi:hypothetical protein